METSSRSIYTNIEYFIMNLSKCNLHIFLLLFFIVKANSISIHAQDLKENIAKSDWLKRNGNRQESLRLLNEVITKSETLNDNKLKANALYEKAEWFNYYMQYDSAIIHGENALEFVEKNNLQSLLPKFLLQNGWLVLKKYDSQSALNYCRSAKDLAKKYNQSLIMQICNVCIEDALGIYYLGALGEEYYYPVLQAYEKAVQLYKAEKDTSNYVAYYTRYIDLYRLRGTQDSIHMFLEDLQRVHTNYTNLRLKASLHSLQSIFAYFENDLNAVYENLTTAQRISKKLNLPQLTQHFYIRLHSYYKELNQYNQSIEMLDSAVATYKVDHIHANGFDLYYYVYKKAGNTEKALEYLEKWHNDEDWKRKNEKVELITEWETKYKSQESEAQLRIEKSQRYWLMAFTGLLVLFIIFLIKAFQRQKKAGTNLAHQKQVIEKQSFELQKLDKIKSRFFANVSHELRTPLTLILGPITSVLKNGGLNKQSSTLLNMAQSSGNQLLKMVNSILDLSRMESGKMELAEEVVALYPLIRRIFSQFESNAQIRDIKLVLDFKIDPYITLKLDISKFETILNNLISNALKFTPSGGSIDIKCLDLSNRISLEVKDTGSGIHPDDLPYIFNRFYQSKQSNAPTEGGSGIGLALSKEFAKLLDGTLIAKSQLGEGSSFYFEFPKKEVFGFIEEETIKIPESYQSTTTVHDVITEQVFNGTCITKQKTSILLVEDNPSLRQYLQMILGGDYDLSIAENGVVALEKLATLPNCQLIISDVMMPIMDGYQLLEKLKKDDRWRSIPVVMLTARAALDDKLKALRIGVDDYILKPFEEEELIVRIENLLSNSQLRLKQAEEPQKSDIKNDLPSVSQDELEWLEKVEHTIQLHLGNSQFTLGQLAQSLFISERQFNRKIKKMTGLTPNKYIREIKLQKAREMIETRRYNSVAQICQGVGFSKTEYFSKLYKERFGKTPASYLF